MINRLIEQTFFNRPDDGKPRSFTTNMLLSVKVFNILIQEGSFSISYEDGEYKIKYYPKAEPVFVRAQSDSLPKAICMIALRSRNVDFTA